MEMHTRQSLEAIHGISADGASWPNLAAGLRRLGVAAVRLFTHLRRRGCRPA